MEAEN